MTRRGGHHLLQRVAAVDQGAQRALGEGDPGATGVGQAHAVWGAQEKRGAELAFESLEARGQGRLGDEEGLGRPADAAPAGDLEEALDLDELDATWLPVTGFFYGHGRTLQILSIGTDNPDSPDYPRFFWTPSRFVRTIRGISMRRGSCGRTTGRVRQQWRLSKQVLL